MVDFKKLEEDALEAVRKVVDDAQEHEPAIEDAAMSALAAVGVPGPVIVAMGGLLSSLLSHFQEAQKAATPSEPLAPLPPEGKAGDSPGGAESASEAGAAWPSGTAPV